MRKISRRQAIQSLATFTGAALIQPLSVFAADPVKNTLRFAVIGDWGTGDADQIGTSKQMLSAHRQTPFDLVIAAGDNIYPNGEGRHFTKNFERPFAPLLDDRINFYAVLG